MKPQTYLRLSLLLSYILWGIALLLVSVSGGFDASPVDDTVTIPHLDLIKETRAEITPVAIQS